MALDVLFQSTGEQLVQSFYGAPAFTSLAAGDASEAHMFTATAFLDSMYGDSQSEARFSRAQTPMAVSTYFIISLAPSNFLCRRLAICMRGMSGIPSSRPLSPTAQVRLYIPSAL
jgi:hypothetical protein